MTERIAPGCYNGTVQIRDRVKDFRRVPASQLRPHPKNWRRHPKAQQDAMRGVLAEIGFADALLVRETPEGLQLIDGHLRADITGDTPVPMLVLDLNEAEADKLLVTLDPLAMMAEADQERLAALLQDARFESQAVDDMLKSLAVDEHLFLLSPHGLAEDPGPQIDQAEKLQKKWQTERGQVWEIPSKIISGKAHRLMCGDSTNAVDVRSLMNGEVAMLFATDPPYGIDYDSSQLHRNGSHYDTIEMDNLKGLEYQTWLQTCFEVWLPHLAVNAAWYLWHPMLTQGYYAAAAAAAGLIISRQIIWVKPQFVFGKGHYHWQHELCFYGWRKGYPPPFHGDRNQSTIWSIGYDGQRNNRNHPTQKPAALWHAPMNNHLTRGQIAAEPFSGSGSQIVAAEQTGCICYGMEINPKYVAVALERMVKMGLQPRCVSCV